VPTASPLRPETTSTEQHVYELLRDRIVRAVYEPGAKLLLLPLSEELEVSTMPVRAALKRLDADGLVTYRPHKGATVAALRIEEFEDILDIRIALESVAGRLGASRVDDHDVARMRSILAELKRPGQEYEELVALEWRGYLICYEAARRPRLLRMILDFGRMAERYSRYARGEVFDHSSIEYFRQLIEACDARDPAAAEVAVASGLRAFLQKLTRQLIADEEVH
jgi:DNA-binding GntR family transcriptional regulator